MKSLHFYKWIEIWNDCFWPIFKIDNATFFLQKDPYPNELKCEPQIIFSDLHPVSFDGFRELNRWNLGGSNFFLISKSRGLSKVHFNLLQNDIGCSLKPIRLIAKKLVLLLFISFRRDQANLIYNLNKKFIWKFLPCIATTFQFFLPEITRKYTIFYTNLKYRKSIIPSLLPTPSRWINHFIEHTFLPNKFLSPSKDICRDGEQLKLQLGFNYNAILSQVFEMNYIFGQTIDEFSISNNFQKSIY